MIFGFERKMVYFQTGSRSAAVLGKMPKLNERSAELDELLPGLIDPQDEQFGESLKFMKSDLQKRIQSLQIIPEESRKKLEPMVSSVKDAQQFLALEEQIQEAIKYAKTLEDAKELFDENDIREGIKFILDPNNLKQASQYREKLEKEFIPEEKKRLSKVLDWDSFDKDITNKYQARGRKERDKDKQQILCEEVEKNLSAKYQIILQASIDTTTVKGKNKYEALMFKFKRELEGPNADFDARQQALIKAKDKILALQEKSPAYQAWHKKIRARWGKIDKGRLMGIFESLQEDHEWDLAVNESKFEQAKKLYESELRSKYRQLIPSIFYDKQTQDDWIKNFEEADLEVKVDMYQQLLKNRGKFSAEDKKWFAKIDKIRSENPALHQAFNKKYLQFYKTRDRNLILSETEQEYQDLLKKYEALVQKIAPNEQEKQKLRLEFKALPDFESMRGKIDLILSETTEKKACPRQRSGEKRKKKNAKEELPKGLEERVHEKLQSFFASEQGQISFLLGNAVSMVKRSQQFHQNANAEDNISKEAAEFSDIGDNVLKKTLDSCETVEEKKRVIKAHMNNPSKFRTFSVKILNEHQESLLRDPNDRRRLATMQANQIIPDTQSRLDNRGWACGFRFTDDNGNDKDFTKDREAYNLVYGDRELEENERMAETLLKEMGLEAPSDDILDEIIAMVGKMRVNYLGRNRKDMLKNLANRE